MAKSLPYQGHLHTVANRHLSYEIAEAEAEFIHVLVEHLQQQFGLGTVSQAVMGIDEVILEVKLQGVRLGIGWDNWSGAYVMAYCSQGDSLVEKIRQSLCASGLLVS